MIDWKRRVTTSYRFMRVSRQTGAEMYEIDGISRSGGEITENLNIATKVSGSLKLERAIDFGDDMIRIYADAKDSSGSSETVALATLFATTPTRTHSGARITGKVSLYSTLLSASEDGISEPMTIPAGSLAVSTAAAILSDAGLTVVSEMSASTLTGAHTYAAGTSRLKIANDLLSYAGFGSAGVDGYGRVVLSPYIAPEGVAPGLVFRDDEASIVKPGADESRDWYATPNRIVARVSRPDEYMQAVSENRDPASPYSIPRRMRTITRTEDVTDIESQAALQAYADNLLVSSTRQMSSLTFQHGYSPAPLGSVQRVALVTSGLDFTGSLQERRITLDYAMQCTSRIRRFE